MPMNYEECLDMLLSKVKALPNEITMKTDARLHKIYSIYEALGEPSKNLPKIHVAGTNGKGSVVLKIARGFKLSGYKVGTFTSPHIVSPCERIKVSDTHISQEDFAKHFSKVFSASEKLLIPLNFFESLFLLSLSYFQESQVDIAIFEVGVGGRFDTTNVIQPILSVITSIGNDHMPDLGTTLEEVAWQKGGIIKELVPVILGPKAQQQTVLDIANKKKSQMIFTSACGGFYDEENMDIAATALKYLSKKFSQITDEMICLAAKARPSCRFEVLPSFMGERLSSRFVFPNFVVMDVAHNIDGIKAVFEAIKLKLGQKNVRVILGLSKDKQDSSVLTFFKNNASGIHLLPIEHSRLEKPSNLHKRFLNLGCDKVFMTPTSEDALKEALLLAKENEEVILITGSCYIMGDVRKLLGYKETVNSAQVKNTCA